MGLENQTNIDPAGAGRESVPATSMTFELDLIAGIRAGRISVTRRPATPQPEDANQPYHEKIGGNWFARRTPFGNVGTRLRVLSPLGEETGIVIRFTAIRLSPLQDITDNEARAEGMRSPLRVVGAHKMLFRRRWDDRYLAAGLGWDRNPWVWVMHFEVV